MNVEKQVAWMPMSVRRGLVALDFSMLDYQEDAWHYCSRHPADVSSEADLNDDGRACRAYILAHTKEDEVDDE